MNHDIIIKLILSSLALTICYFGVREDREKRRFSNNKIMILIILGLFMAYFNSRLGIGILWFLIMNVVGIFMTLLGVLGASDWKLFSTICLFIPIENSFYAFVYAFIVIIYAFIQKIKNTNKGKLKEAFIDEWNAVKVLVFTKQRMVEDTTRGVYKESTVPMTEGLVIAFAITLFMFI